MNNLSAQHQAKRPRTPLTGPYGHPLHPTLVTIPIRTWTASISSTLLPCSVTTSCRL